MTLHKKIKWFFGLFVLANIIIVLMVALGAFELPPPKPMPNPNGYDDFVKAGKMLILTTNDFSTMTEVELAALVATNAEALKLVRVGLSQECRVPNDYSTNYIDLLLPQLASQKQLALSFCAEGRLATLQGRTNDAAQSYLDAANFGLHCGQGGVLIYKLVDLACESLGRSGLAPLLDGVGPQECRKVAQTLEMMDVAEDSEAQIWKQEKEYGRKTGTLGQKIAALMLYKQRQQTMAKFEAKYQKNQLARRQMMIDFAARAYQLDKGKPPAAVNGLVPDYLKAIPKAPVSGSNLVLRASAP